MIGYFVLSYFIGNIMTGYFIVRGFGKQDIRKQGSGNVGARNAGRLYGKSAFFLTFLGDAGKGALVIILARLLHFSVEIQLIGLAIAIIGHLKPMMLMFKGGKGISTFIGGMVAFDPFLVPVMIPGFLLFYLLTKSATLAGLGSFLLIPAFFLYQNHSLVSCLTIVIILCLIYMAHYENIFERLKKHERKK